MYSFVMLSRENPAMLDDRLGFLVVWFRDFIAKIELLSYFWY